MKVAEIQITAGRTFSAPVVSVVGFDDAAKAKEEYDRLVEAIKRRAERANDVEKLVRLVGITEFPCALDDVAAISLALFADLDEQEKGVRDAFPNLFKR